MDPGPALRHHALVYGSDEEYLACAVPFLREGLEAGEGAVVAHTRGGLAMMRSALGADAGAVAFVDVGEAYTRPARTLAAYHAVYAEQLERAPSVRAVADVQVGPEPREWDRWTGYEAAFNRSFEHLPVWVLCSYDGAAVPGAVLDGVRRTHPDVVTGDGWAPSDRFEDPDRVLRAVTPHPEPLPGLRSVPFTGGPEALREALAAELSAAGVPPGRALDLLLAVTEVATNAVKHGQGITAVRAGTAGGRFVCEIADRGTGFDDPAAGYLAPRAGVGAGLWVARQLTWQLDFHRAPDGFTARLTL